MPDQKIEPALPDVSVSASAANPPASRIVIAIELTGLSADADKAPALLRAYLTECLQRALHAEAAPLFGTTAATSISVTISEVAA